MLRIGVDIDNVLAQTDQRIRALILLRFGIRARPSDIATWFYHQSLPISREQEASILDEFHHYHCSSLQPVPGAQRALGRLIPRARILLLTQRPETTKADTLHWLRTNDIPYHELRFVRSKASRHLHLSLLIDDNADTALAAAASGVRTLLYDRPWNRLPVSHPQVTRVHGWWHIERIAGRAILATHSSPR